MTLAKAIEIAELWYKGGYAAQIDDMNPAIKLLIEAGKRILTQRVLYTTTVQLSLPGETIV